MLLKRVEKGSSALKITCCNCNQLRREIECYANLHGEPFKDYYCQECAENIAPKQVDGLIVYGRE